MSGTARAWTVAADGVRLRIRLVPKSSRDAIEGIEDTPDRPALKARVRAVPEDGRANAAIETLVADWLGVTRSTVTLASGHKSRIKSLHITGAPAALVARIEALVAKVRADAPKPAIPPRSQP